MLAVWPAGPAGATGSFVIRGPTLASAGRACEDAAMPVTAPGRSVGDTLGGELMDTPGERQAAAELLAATRDLVAVNREIAGSLARLEQLYAREVERNADMRARTNA